jgi:hypothetical protein
MLVVVSFGLAGSDQSGPGRISVLREWSRSLSLPVTLRHYQLPPGHHPGPCLDGDWRGEVSTFPRQGDKQGWLSTPALIQTSLVRVQSSRVCFPRSSRNMNIRMSHDSS